MAPGRRRVSAKRDRDLLEEVQCVLQAGLHPRVDDGVPGYLARCLDEERYGRASVCLGECRSVDGCPLLFGHPFGQTLVDFGRDDPFVGDDLTVLTVETDLESVVGEHYVPP